MKKQTKYVFQSWLIFIRMTGLLTAMKKTMSPAKKPASNTPESEEVKVLVSVTADRTKPNQTWKQISADFGSMHLSLNFSINIFINSIKMF